MAKKQAKPITAQEAASLVRSNDWVDYGFGLGQPDLFDAALAARAGELAGVRIRGAFSLRPRPTLEADPDAKHFLWSNWHFSGWDRRQHDAGRVTYVPMNFGEAPDYYRRFVEPIDVVCIKTAPMDAHGHFNFGAAVSYHKAMCERAKLVIVETSAAMPYVFGGEESLHASEVDYVIEGDGAPLAELVNPEPSAVDRKVGAQIAAEVEDGACLQVGIGGMPAAVCSMLRDSGVRDLGIHTEMFVDPMVDLIESGQVTGARKGINRFQSIYTFAFGTRRSYAFLDRNPRVQSFPVDYTNLPHNIMQNERVISINNTTEIDLQGQAASESSGHRHLTGTGGQLQFVRGAYASPGGKSFICLSSCYERGGVRKSRITSQLTPGNIVTTPRTDVMYVVTEYGMVNLKGKSVAERAKALIGLAHPEFREGLERDARQRNLIPKGW